MDSRGSPPAAPLRGVGGPAEPRRAGDHADGYRRRHGLRPRPLRNAAQAGGGRNSGRKLALTLTELMKGGPDVCSKKHRTDRHVHERV